MLKSEQYSPLRYPGGKALLSGYIADVLEANILTCCTFYEPYVGGASVSLDLLSKGYIAEAVWLEADPLIYAFWYCAINHHQQFCEELCNLKVSIETWESFQVYRQVKSLPTKIVDLVRLGLAGLFFNRTNFSGIIGAGPIGGKSQGSEYGIGCRFNREALLNKITYIYDNFSKRISVNYGDAVSFLQGNRRKIESNFSFVYIDPPYYKEGKKLYRYFYEDSDHNNLASFLKLQSFPWLVSYDDHPFIRDLYSENEVQPIYLDYRVRTSKKAQELLISNLIIPPPVYEKLGILAA